MKTKAFLLAFSWLVLACNNPASEAPKEEANTTPEHTPIEEASTSSKEPNFDWLLGDWARTNDAEGQSTYEQWQKVEEHVYKGIGMTLESEQKVSEEQMQFIQENGDWRLEVRLPNNPEPTIFKVTQLTENEFQAENPENDFPKIIHYKRTGDIINAVIKAGDQQVDFVFKAIESIPKS